MDFSTITEILIPLADGSQMSAVQLDVNGQTLWTAKEPEVPWTPLWRGPMPLSFGTSASSVTVTPNNTYNIPALPIKSSTDPAGSFELRLLLDFKVSGTKGYLRTAKTAADPSGTVIGEFTAGVQYKEVPVVFQPTGNIYANTINHVGMVTSTSQTIPTTGNANASYSLVIATTYYTSGSVKYLRLQVKTIKPATGFG